jgi:hypothetical protein
MAQNQHLLLYFKFYQLTKYLYERVRNFPKQYKYSLGQNILDLSWSCLDLLVAANAFSREEKHLKVVSLSIAFDCLKVRLRMAQETGALSVKQYVHLQSFYLKEVGEMIGGWLKWSSQYC